MINFKEFTYIGDWDMNQTPIKEVRSLIYEPVYEEMFDKERLDSYEEKLNELQS